MEKCRVCDGTGKVHCGGANCSHGKCETCEGYGFFSGGIPSVAGSTEGGKYTCFSCSGTGRCPYCSGTGYLRCSYCNGTGVSPY